MALQSLAKQNFSTESEDAIVQQIQVEQTAQHTYLACASYFGRDDVALPGLEKHFLKQAEREGHRAQILIDYQNMRGGRVVIKEISQPQTEWASARNAVETALALEKDVNKSLLNLHAVAANSTDPELEHQMKRGHLTERVHEIEEVAKGLTQLERVGNNGLGLYLWDQKIYQNDGEYTTGE
ncbi:ferritin-like superfamily [Syncephalastrum racemosum]|uniref:Ferritin n=1 Tax=Syncephalastrum racemosum TaxID=13706 RepID=A0A1X2HJA9_SYNRA|nr:ferritin-like superfamily [Syncephalastrum racemosum]